ncbi:extracellular solute-binding protein [Pseudoroseicyclus aestuarii]|uniref:Carbohydrate ABC transporter substrate-binding protein (CUT1 family) n=1 Tax=Pseudoroseicyclus aestuarii TaxID=1795041 RepID=A0A318SQ24_9RHOB|nr:extracellular solute-binding protein [Pseudoroseicyclus aestuarii]PYE82448.1 carbohydrate ABC transporter substrate-binding protein (CUT1 family) [Pseudoroseicyclus aestuarii]
MKAPIQGAAICALFAGATPALADVSIMYPDWITALVEPAIEAYEAETGETVTSTRLPTDGYDRRIAVDLAAGTAADVVVLDSFMVAQLADAGYLASLDEQLADWDQYQQFMPALLDVTSFDGTAYALPVDTDVRMLWYNRSVFEEAGIEMPWTPETWDDVLETATTIKDETGIDYAFVLPAGTKQGEAATMQGFYMALLGADTAEGERNRLRNWEEGKWIADSPAIRQVAELYDEVYNQRELTEPSINYATDLGNATREALASNELGIFASGSWERSCLFNCNGVDIPSPEERAEIVGWTPWPSSGAEGAEQGANVSGGWAMGLNAGSGDMEAAKQLLTTIFDYDNFQPWVVDNGRMAVREDIAASEDFAANDYLAAVTELSANTTGRDTYPGYQVVSSLIQDMTGAILDGVPVDEALEEYREALVDEFGEDSVMTLD